MNTPQYFVNEITKALSDPGKGLVALVDALLRGVTPQPIQLEWRPEGLAIFYQGDESSALIVKVRLGLFRSIMARIAIVCRETSGIEVSPYGGEALIPSLHDPQSLLDVRFQNTSTEQSLVLVLLKQASFPKISTTLPTAPTQESYH